MTFLDVLLAADPSLQAQLKQDSVDSAAGVTYGIYYQGRLIAEEPSEWQARFALADNADAMDVPVSHLRIEPLDAWEVAA